MEGGVKLGSLGTAATNRPIVPAPGDYNDGEIDGMIGRGNRSTQRELAPMLLCPPQIPHTARTATNRLSFVIRLTADMTLLLKDEKQRRTRIFVFKVKPPKGCCIGLSS
jgi:hypothetical protein